MKRRAFTLGETVFALSLTLLVLMLVFNLFPTSAVAGQRARQQLRASSMAQALLEEARARPFASLRTERMAAVEEDGVRFLPTQEVLPVPGEDPQELVSVRVTVRWDYQGLPRQLSQETFVARLPR